MYWGGAWWGPGRIARHKGELETACQSAAPRARITKVLNADEIGVAFAELRVRHPLPTPAAVAWVLRLRWEKLHGILQAFVR